MVSKFAGQDAASWVGVTETGKPHVQQSGVTAPSSGGVAPGGARPKNQAVDDIVRTMQNLMIDLGTQLNKPGVAQSVVERLKQESPNTQITVKDISNKALAFSHTASASSSRATPADGVWGNNTRQSLLAIKNFAAQINANITISEGAGQVPYRTMKDEELIAAARENINNISKLFGALGISTSVESVANSTGMAIVDMIDPTLPGSGTSDPFGAGWGTRPVTLGDLAGFDSFFNFIRGLKPSFPCSLQDTAPISEKKSEPVSGTLTSAPKPTTASFDNYLEVLAKEILDNSIVRLGQDVVAPSDPYCFSVIGNIIKWFSDRANKMFDSLYEAISSPFHKPSPRPDRNGKAATIYDAQLGKYYVDQMTKISNAWDDMKDSIRETLKARGGSRIVSKKLIDEISKKPRASGKAHQKHEEGRDEEGSGGRTISQSTMSPPLDSFIVSSNFMNAPGAKNLEELSRKGILPELNLREWSSGAWTSLALSDVEGEIDSQKYANFGRWANAVRDFLEGLYTQYSEKIKENYDDWRRGNHNDQLAKDQRDKIRDSLVTQRDWLNRWVGKINGTLGTWNREYKERMDRANRGL